MGCSQLTKPPFWCAQTTHISVETEPRSCTWEQAQSSPWNKLLPQRAGALKRSLRSWVLGSSRCTGAFSAVQLLNVLFFYGMCNEIVTWGCLWAKQNSGHPNQVSTLKEDVERIGEVCRRATKMTCGLKNKKKTACHKKPIAWNCLTEGL